MTGLYRHILAVLGLVAAAWVAGCGPADRPAAIDPGPAATGQLEPAQPLAGATAAGIELTPQTGATYVPFAPFGLQVCASEALLVKAEAGFYDELSDFVPLPEPDDRDQDYTNRGICCQEGQRTLYRRVISFRVRSQSMVRLDRIRVDEGPWLVLMDYNGNEADIWPVLIRHLEEAGIRKAE